MFFSIWQVLSGKNPVSVNDHLTPSLMFKQNIFCSFVDTKELHLAELILKKYNAGISNDIILIFCESMLQIFQNKCNSKNDGVQNQTAEKDITLISVKPLSATNSAKQWTQKSKSNRSTALLDLVKRRYLCSSSMLRRRRPHGALYITTRFPRHRVTCLQSRSYILYTAEYYKENLGCTWRKFKVIGIWCDTTFNPLVPESKVWCDMQQTRN